MDFRKFFPIEKAAPIYLNSGTHSLTPAKVLEAVQRYQREYEKNPTLGLFEAYGRLWRAQSRVASFFGADAKDVFLRSNVTEVLNEFVLGVDLPQDAEIAMTDLEYGAIVNLVKFRCRRDGLEERIIRLPGRLPEGSKEILALTPNSLVEKIVSQLGPRTRMLVCSDVMTANGLVVPIEKLAKETRRRGIYLVVDGAHGPGSQELDFGKLADLDFYGGNLHKWMMGPKGTSFGWVNPIHQEKIRPTHAGWTTFETAYFFEAFGEGSRFQGRMLMVGCRDFAPFFALDDMIGFWEELGPRRVRERIFSLQSDLEEKMRRLDLAPLSPGKGTLRGPLLSYEMPEPARKAPLELFFSLAKKHGLQVNLPILHDRPVLRLSPHIYNTPEENTAAVEILGKALPR